MSPSVRSRPGRTRDAGGTIVQAGWLYASIGVVQEARLRKHTRCSHENPIHHRHNNNKMALRNTVDLTGQTFEAFLCIAGVFVAHLLFHPLPAPVGLLPSLVSPTYVHPIKNPAPMASPQTRQVLSQLKTKDENNVCFECGRAQPRVGEREIRGIFACSVSYCAQIWYLYLPGMFRKHSALGVHISFVRSFSPWTSGRTRSSSA